MKLHGCLTKLVSSAIIFSVIFSTLPARADCYTIDNAPLDAECVVMPFGSARGVWFRLDKADALRKMKLESVELKRQISLYEKQVEELESSSEKYAAAYSSQVEATKSMESINAALVSAAAESKRAEAAAKEKLSVWYRSPALWFGGGVVLTVSAGIVGILLSK